ncbi:MAG: YceI family protein [Chitinophagaceae bacterium]|jgi:polyisoprenoid-binding protein YceI|nr:YceI family protein [Chitinophagaceae bacterium]
MKRNFFSLLVLFVAAICSLPALASPPLKFKVDGNASSLEWVARKITGKHNGFVKVTSGEVVMDGGMLKSGTFQIDMTTMTVEDIKDPGTNGKLLGHLKSDDFFSVANHPTATFVVSSVTPKSGSIYTVKGKLTIKGITKDIEFPADITVSGKTMKATADIKVDRTQFDIKYRSSNFFENLGDKAIYDDFDLKVSLVATL